MRFHRDSGGYWSILMNKRWDEEPTFQNEIHREHSSSMWRRILRADRKKIKNGSRKLYISLMSHDAHSPCSYDDQSDENCVGLIQVWMRWLKKKLMLKEWNKLIQALFLANAQPNVFLLHSTCKSVSVCVKKNARIRSIVFLTWTEYGAKIFLLFHNSNFYSASTLLVSLK